MRIYRATYKDRDGKQRKSAKWYLDFSDHNQLRHKIPAFTDKRLSEALGRNIESLVNSQIAGLEPDVKLNQWLETMSDSLLKKFASWGLITGQRTEITKPLSEHIKDYVNVLKAKGYVKEYIRHTQNRLKKIVTDCRFYYFRDITKSTVEIYIGKLIKDGASKTTAGHYLDSLKSFINWAQLDQRITNNPIAKISKPTRDSEQKGILTAEQFIKLIKDTFEKNILIGRTSGQERAILYILAGTTGIRKKELLSLTWSDINLSAENPFICIRASIAKNHKEALQPLVPMAVSILQALKAHTRPTESDRVFPAFKKTINTADLIRDDLKVAGLPLFDREGNEIVFHSLRNSYISFLANSQTPAKVIQKLARHSDPKLTFNTYARVLPEAEQKAMNFLPNIGNFVLSTCLDNFGKKQEILRGNQRQKNSRDTQKTAFPAVQQTPRVGLEPTT
ncbi:tyrosine-type recombinase/integrase [Planctomycetota bacterium]